MYELALEANQRFFRGSVGPSWSMDLSGWSTVDRWGMKQCGFQHPDISRYIQISGYPDISRYNIKIIKPDQLQPGSYSELQQWCLKTSIWQFIIHHSKKSDMMELWCLKYAQMLIAATELSLECQVSISILQCTTSPNVIPVTWDKRGLFSPQPSIIHFAWFDTFRRVLPWTTFDKAQTKYIGRWWTMCSFDLNSSLWAN